MKVNDIPSAKLTKRGDNLRGPIARCINFVSKHNSENCDVVLLAGTNDLSNRNVSPDDLIGKPDSSLTELIQFDNVRQSFSARFLHDQTTITSIVKLAISARYSLNVSVTLKNIYLLLTLFHQNFAFATKMAFI